MFLPALPLAPWILWLSVCCLREFLHLRGRLFIVCTYCLSIFHSNFSQTAPQSNSSTSPEQSRESSSSDHIAVFTWAKCQTSAEKCCKAKPMHQLHFTKDTCTAYPNCWTHFSLVVRAMGRPGGLTCCSCSPWGKFGRHCSYHRAGIRTFSSIGGPSWWRFRSSCSTRRSCWCLESRK